MAIENYYSCQETRSSKGLCTPVAPEGRSDGGRSDHERDTLHHKSPRTCYLPGEDSTQKDTEHECGSSYHAYPTTGDDGTSPNDCSHIEVAQHQSKECFSEGNMLPTSCGKKVRGADSMGACGWTFESSTTDIQKPGTSSCSYGPGGRDTSGRQTILGESVKDCYVRSCPPGSYLRGSECRDESVEPVTESQEWSPGQNIPRDIYSQPLIHSQPYPETETGPTASRDVLPMPTQDNLHTHTPQSPSNPYIQDPDFLRHIFLGSQLSEIEVCFKRLYQGKIPSCFNRTEFSGSVPLAYLQ